MDPRPDELLISFLDTESDEMPYCASTGYCQSKPDEPIFVVRHFPRNYKDSKHSLCDGPIMREDGTLLPRKRMRPWRKLETHAEAAVKEQKRPDLKLFDFVGKNKQFKFTAPNIC